MSPEKEMNLKLYHAIYYFRCKGYLSAVDILKEINASGINIKNCETIKIEFID